MNTKNTLPNLSALEDMAIRYYLRKMMQRADFGDYEARYKEVAANAEQMKQIITEYKKYAGLPG